MSAGTDIEVSRQDGTRFTLRDKNLPWARDVYPASGGWTVRALPGRSREVPARTQERSSR
jgi:hypothetical protein